MVLVGLRAYGRWMDPHLSLSVYLLLLYYNALSNINILLVKPFKFPKTTTPKYLSTLSKSTCIHSNFSPKLIKPPSILLLLPLNFFLADRLLHTYVHIF